MHERENSSGPRRKTARVLTVALTAPIFLFSMILIRMGWEGFPADRYDLITGLTAAFAGMGLVMAIFDKWFAIRIFWIVMGCLLLAGATAYSQPRIQKDWLLWTLIYAGAWFYVVLGLWTAFSAAPDCVRR